MSDKMARKYLKSGEQDLRPCNTGSIDKDINFIDIDFKSMVERFKLETDKTIIGCDMAQGKDRSVESTFNGCRWASNDKS